MTREQLEREARTHSGEDLGRTIFRDVQAALNAGMDRDEIIAVVTELYDELGEAGSEDDQDAIADVLDSLTGFCSPTAAL